MRRALVIGGVALAAVTVGAQAPWVATGVAVGFVVGYVVGAIHATRGEFEPDLGDVPAGLPGRFGRHDKVHVTRFNAPRAVDFPDRGGWVGMPDGKEPPR